MSEELEKRLREYEESGDYVEDGLLEKAAAELKAQRKKVSRLEKEVELRKRERNRWLPRPDHNGKKIDDSCDMCKVDKAEAARDKAMADVERLTGLLAGLVGLIQLCQHRFPADLQDEIKVHWRFTEAEAEAALKEPKP